jgi:hypothetical protein
LDYAGISEYDLPDTYWPGGGFGADGHTNGGLYGTPVQYNLNMNGSQAVSGFNSHTTPGLQNDSEFILIQQRMRIFMWYFSNY